MDNDTGNAIDSTFGNNPDVAPPTGNFSSKDIWQEAKSQFYGAKGGAVPQTVDTLNVPKAVDPVTGTDTGFDGEGVEAPAQEPAPETQTPAFNPYEFKGKVLGQEMNKTFNDPKELNRMIERGFASEKLYNQYKDLQNKVRELEPRASSAENFDRIAKESPTKLLELIFEKHIGQEQAAQWVLEKYNHFRKLASMSPEERIREKRLQEADRILAANEKLLETQRQSKEQEQQQSVQRRREEKTSWARSELNLLKAKFRGIEDGVIQDQIVAVLNMADNHETRTGTPYSAEQRTALLRRYMKHFEPMVKTQANSSHVRGQRQEELSRQATQTLQNAARTSNGSVAPAKSPTANGAPSAKSVWKDIIAAARSGEIKLKG